MGIFRDELHLVDIIHPPADASFYVKVLVLVYRNVTAEVRGIIFIVQAVVLVCIKIAEEIISEVK